MAQKQTGLVSPNASQPGPVRSSFRPLPVKPQSNQVDLDHAFIKGRAYGTDDKLSARQGIYAFSKPTGQPNFFEWGVGRIPWVGEEFVVDVGCGNGMWLRRIARLQSELRTVGVDLSEGMIRSSVAGLGEGVGHPAIVADAQALPLRDGCADVVFLMHMLYHVPNVALALSEGRRVLRAEGTALVSTVGSEHLIELRTLLYEALSDVAGQPIEGPLLVNQCDIARAQDELQASFSHVSSYVATGVLEIPVPGPIVAYLDSQQGPDLDAHVPPGGTWADVLDSARRSVEADIRTREIFRTRTEVGVFVCRP